MARVLLVEDEPVLADLLREVLEQSGHEIEVAHEVTAGITAFDRNPHDLVVTDFLLPDRTGLDLARHLSESEAPTPPIVLVTAYLEPELQTRVDADEAIVEVVRKPLDVFAFRRLVDATIDDRRGSSPMDLGDSEASHGPPEGPSTRGCGIDFDLTRPRAPIACRSSAQIGKKRE